jgi:hypothetical protein
MSVCSEVADYEWLTGDEAAALLGEYSACSLPLHSEMGRLRRHLSPDRAHLVAEQVDLRRRAEEKFSTADLMFFTRTALEQATDEHIARYKAARIALRVEHINARSSGCGQSQRGAAIADLCCGIGGDLLALAERNRVVAVDCSPVATHFAAANLRAVVPSADAQFRTMDASELILDNIIAWHLDPDRRASGRRTTSLEFCQPDVAVIERLLHCVPHAAIKLAPACTVPRQWAERCELEWISRGGECRQLVAWHGELAEHPGQRRATIVATHGIAPRTLTGMTNQSIPIARQIRDYVFDIDPAVLAAHLKGALAAIYNLSALDSGPTYLTGDSPISDPALSCFRVDAVLPLRTQALARHLREYRVGQLEIKKRGVDIVPEKLRRELKLRGDNTATLLIAKVAGRATAILAHRVAC